MPIITIFSGGFCHENQIVQEVMARTGYRQISEHQIIAEASRKSTLTKKKSSEPFLRRPRFSINSASKKSGHWPISN